MKKRMIGISHLVTPEDFREIEKEEYEDVTVVTVNNKNVSRVIIEYKEK